MSDFESPPVPPPLKENQPAAVESRAAEEPTAMQIAQREAAEAAGDADPRDRVWGAPDWLTAQSKFQSAGRPKPRPKSSYAFQPRKGK